MKGLDWGIVRQPRVPRCWKVWASDAARWPGQGRLSSRGPEGWRASNPLPAQPHSLGAKGLHDHSNIFRETVDQSSNHKPGYVSNFVLYQWKLLQSQHSQLRITIKSWILNLSILDSWRSHLRNVTGKAIKMTKACVNVILAVKSEISRELGRQG